jgi:hypothetical protein
MNRESLTMFCYVDISGQVRGKGFPTRVQRGVVARLGLLGQRTCAQPPVGEPARNFGERQIQHRRHLHIPLCDETSPAPKP